MNYSVEEYKMFMRKTGLFSLISEHVINNLVDYVTGVEVGLDSNGRKNRGGHLMENLVEDYLQKAGLVKGYGDGKMGADDFITIEQVGLLVERSDAALSTVAPGESFYGYINEKLFRNATLEEVTTIDPVHGAVITNADYWSAADDIFTKISILLFLYNFSLSLLTK